MREGMRPGRTITRVGKGCTDRGAVGRASCDLLCHVSAKVVLPTKKVGSGWRARDVHGREKAVGYPRRLTTRPFTRAPVRRPEWEVRKDLPVSRGRPVSPTIRAAANQAVPVRRSTSTTERKRETPCRVPRITTLAVPAVTPAPARHPRPTTTKRFLRTSTATWKTSCAA